MELQSIESYLADMTLKRKWFGGYDPEDVILKMQELVRIAKASNHTEQIEKERAKRMKAEKKAVRLRRSLQENKALRLKEGSETEKLCSFLASLEDAKKDILHRYKKKAKKAAKCANKELLLTQKNGKIKKTTTGEGKYLIDAKGRMMKAAKKTTKRDDRVGGR